LQNLGIDLISGDVTDRVSLINGMKGCDAVINLANVYSFWEPNKQIYTQVNVEGTRNVMQAVLETEVSKVVHISTYGIYGNPIERPFTEESQIGPSRTSEYTRSKYDGDLIAWELYEKQGLPLIVIYPCNVLGPGDPKATGQYIKRLVRQKMPAVIFEDTVFTCVHVKDVAEATVRVLEKKDIIGQKYIIGKYKLSIREVNQMIHEISGVPLPRIRLPGYLATFLATIFTFVADVVKRPPPWGMSKDQVRAMKESMISDGTKAERELGIKYTPIRIAFDEAIAFYRK
jgi:dihydroflavonol-4-reductase